MIGKLEYRILDSSLNKPMTYTGLELRPHWGLEKTGVYGSLITAFVGPCKVPTEHLVDMEDRLASDHIGAESMLHFIGEFFGITLESGVLYQRLFMAWAEKLLRERIGAGAVIERSGDDLFLTHKNRRGKLSVSIATVSTTSVLIHWALNIDSSGAPVDALGFKDLGWTQSQIVDFAKTLLSNFCNEVADIQTALVKVRGV